MDTSDVISLIIAGLSASIAFSALYFQWSLRRPRIKGRVNSVKFIKVSIEGDPDKTETVGILVHVSLTNRGRDPVYIMDYDIECDTGQGYQRAEKFPAIKELTLPPVYGFKVEAKNKDWRELQVFYPWKPVEYGVPLTGFLVGDFTPDQSESDIQVDIDELEESIRAVRVTLQDVFGKRKSFESSKDEFVEEDTFLWLLEMAGAEPYPQED